ncbi:hypothetical protein ACEWY4_001763 [Coilia grayii]|uniref:RNase H type-1 domain-containing protein n=1 Tax=Coilia grayii TaxID=363190 RepID=A0ABD1KTV0_9TELE
MIDNPDDVGATKQVVAKATFLECLLPETKKATKLVLGKWEDEATTLTQVLNTANRVARGTDMKLGQVGTGKKKKGRPFVLYDSELEGFMTAVLMQEHGGHQRPVGYYSLKLDTTALGFGPCLRAVQAVFLAIQAIASLALDQQLTVRCPHAGNTLMSMKKVAKVSDSRWGNWQAVSESPNISIQKNTISNPSILIAPTSAEGEEDHHCEDIVALMDEEQPTKEDPLQNPDLMLYTDGSSMVIEGVRCAGWAVTNNFEVMKSASMVPGTSAQQAELKALTEACKLADRKTVNVYKDSSVGI